MVKELSGQEFESNELVIAATYYPENLFFRGFKEVGAPLGQVYRAQRGTMLEYK